MVNKIDAYPTLPEIGNTITQTIKNMQSLNSVKIATSTDIVDLTAQPAEVNNSAITLAENFDYFNVLELVSIARSDNINTTNPTYTPLRGLPYLNQKYSSKSIVALQASEILNTFDYDIRGYFPETGNGAQGEYTYLLDGDIYIDLIKINSERVEVEFLTFKDVFDDTIYT